LQRLAWLVVAQGQRGREWRSLTTKGNKTMSNTPLNAYTVRERGKGKKAFWTRIGRAFPHKSGNGFNLELEALPIAGKIVLMPPKATEAPAETFEQEVGQ
jgi:hypothetical protein